MLYVQGLYFWAVLGIWASLVRPGIPVSRGLLRPTVDKGFLQNSPFLLENFTFC